MSWLADKGTAAIFWLCYFYLWLWAQLGMPGAIEGLRDLRETTRNRDW